MVALASLAGGEEIEDWAGFADSPAVRGQLKAQTQWIRYRFQVPNVCPEPETLDVLLEALHLTDGDDPTITRVHEAHEGLMRAWGRDIAQGDVTGPKSSGAESPATTDSAERRFLPVLWSRAVERSLDETGEGHSEAPPASSRDQATSMPAVRVSGTELALPESAHDDSTGEPSNWALSPGTPRRRTLRRLLIAAAAIVLIADLAYLVSQWGQDSPDESVAAGSTSTSTTQASEPANDQTSTPTAIEGTAPLTTAQLDNNNAEPSNAQQSPQQSPSASTPPPASTETGSPPPTPVPAAAGNSATTSTAVTSPPTTKAAALPPSSAPPPTAPPTTAAKLCNNVLVTVDLSKGQTPTNSADVIIGTDGADSIDGLDGNDLICAGAGNDTIHGNLGNDTIFGEAGDDGITGFDGADTLWGGDGNDHLLGQNSNDVLKGGNGSNDRCDGGSGTDEFYQCEATAGDP